MTGLYRQGGSPNPASVSGTAVTLTVTPASVGRNSAAHSALLGDRALCPPNRDVTLSAHLEMSLSAGVGRGGRRVLRNSGDASPGRESSGVAVVWVPALAGTTRGIFAASVGWVEQAKPIFLRP